MAVSYLSYEAQKPPQFAKYREGYLDGELDINYPSGRTRATIVSPNLQIVHFNNQNVAAYFAALENFLIAFSVVFCKFKLL